jgi:hypothetical protein
LERFKAMARELGADESQDALDKAFSRLDTKAAAAAAAAAAAGASKGKKPRT